MKWKYHLWEFYPNAIYDFQVKLSGSFKKKLIENSCKNKAEFIRRVNNSKYASAGGNASYSRWFNWFRYNDVNIPLWASMAMTELAGISLDELEKEIIFYKQKLTPNRVCVTDPILPIEFTPEFVSLASHFCFDGSLPKDGKGAYYSQKNDTQVELFIGKIQLCFGKTYYKKRRGKKRIWSIRYPRFIGETCKNVCEFSTFDSITAKIPAKIFDLGKKFRLAFLISAIVDEGGIGTEYIQLLLKNKVLIEGLHKICLELGYSCSIIRNKKNKEGVYYFYLKSVSSLYKDVCELSETNPLISFGFKTKDIEFILENQSFPVGKSTLVNAKKRKIRILGKLIKPKSVKELALELKINARSMRRLLLKLTNQGRIYRIKKGHSYLYALN